MRRVYEAEKRPLAYISTRFWLIPSIILWNAVYMGEVLKQLQQEGREINPEDLKHIWPTRFEHINVHGKYEFNVQEEAKREGLRQLRKPDDLNP